MVLSLLVLLVFTDCFWLQLKRMFKKDSVKKTEHLEGMDLTLADHPLVVGGLELVPGSFLGELPPGGDDVKKSQSRKRTHRNMSV